jgi:hypothetical protein
MKRGQHDYQVVQEGSASGGVTSTINTPGETLVPATETNIDTTTNFTLPTDSNPLGSDGAGALTTNPIYPAVTSTAAATTRRTRVTDTSGTAETRSAPADAMSPPASDTDPATPTATDQQQPPPPTDTTGTRG